ncbi:glycosyltransferase family 2 protein [Parvularcula sp. IMCC14364]|uniref:glycosyltransferase family 2 protein n=1 Tax=Parvularcula sp. IMCC14364 TaxID=3067902 RepID=UPI002740C513|nr:glycosyltransferase family 2 protein [Parvularcula sp. IMCC14364]
MITGSLAKPGIVIVNYNSLDYVVEAIASVQSAKQLAGKTRIIVVDNASTTHTFENLHAAVQKSVDGSVATANQAGPRVCFTSGCSKTSEIAIIKAQRNDGFASGCNIGLRYLYETEVDFFLLLNPDTVIDENALQAFAVKLSGDTSYGLVGATLMNTQGKSVSQACSGAKLHGWSLLGKNLGAGLSKEALPSEGEVEQSLSYPVGAAIAFRRDWLEHVGFMDERYFLYYEEADWCRAGADRYRPGWAKNAVVYHHHGATAGSNLAAQKRSALADYHMIRSRMLFALKWYRFNLPVILILTLIQSGRRFLRGQKEQARAVLQAGVPGAARKYIPHA